MVSGSMRHPAASGSLCLALENGSAVTDEITSADESRVESLSHSEHAQGTRARELRLCGGVCTAVMRLGMRGSPCVFKGKPQASRHIWSAIAPVVPILRRQAPQGTQPTNQQQALLAGRSWCTGLSRWAMEEDNDDAPDARRDGTARADGTDQSCVSASMCRASPSRACIR
jgi:hypothetical protein